MLRIFINSSFGYGVWLPILAMLWAAPSLRGQGGRPPPGQEVMFSVTWGDDSGSVSESYTLTIPNAQPATLPNSVPGELMTLPVAFRKGNSYTLTMNHVRTTLKTAPDYDYTLKVDGKGGDVITVLDKGLGGEWVIYDKVRIGGVHNESDKFYAAGKELKFGRISLLTDLNNDGQINELDSNAKNGPLSSATEYMFSDDEISNGAADTVASDDDAEKFQISVDIPGAGSDKIKLSFDTATLQALKFYYDEGLSNEIKFPILLSSLPGKTSVIYAKRAILQNQSDAEVTIPVELYCEVEMPSGYKQTIKIKPVQVCMINRVPSRSFYKAAIDYILERNSRFYVCEGYNYDSNLNPNGNYGIWMLVMRKQGTLIKAINAHSAKPGGAGSIYDFATPSSSYTALVNGVFFNGTGVFLASQTSQGQIISNGIYDSSISTSYPDRANVNQRQGSIMISNGDPASITPPHNVNNYDEALGGLRSGTFRFPSGDAGSVIGIGSIGQIEFVTIAQSITGRSANSVNGLWSFSFDAAINFYGFDGGASIALGIKNPLTGALTILPGYGRRHLSISPERICTYLGFECSSPR